MNIPLILDIALGLIFSYLILSLLASEIQELITTLLQWRAEHLKKSIEVLLAGGRDESLNHTKVRMLANSLYEHPLLRNLNQEAKGNLAHNFRKISRALTSFSRKLFSHGENVFGNQSSGPSYIPPDAFAHTLIEKLKIKQLAQILSFARVEQFKQERLLKQIIRTIQNSEFDESTQKVIEKELNTLNKEFQEILADLKAQKSNLIGSIDRMAVKFQTFIETCQLVLPLDTPARDTFLNRLNLLHQAMFNEQERKVLLATFKPTLNEVLQIISRNADIYAEFEKAVQDQNHPLYQEVNLLIESVPESLKESLTDLANRVKSGVSTIEEDVDRLQQQIEIWFDQSMDRASGVYKRNAKGIALLIGFFVALVSNTDTFHIVGSLSKNSVLRETITQNAEEIVSRNPDLSIQSLDLVKTQLRKALDDVSIPIGWSAANRQQQEDESKEWPFPFLKRVIGWIISGIAISMGASFWFDLLNKVINVRNAGKSDFPNPEKHSTP
jgi:hypothetical protein